MARIPLAPFRLTCALLFALCAGSPPLKAQALSEIQVKAGYLYNFARYIEWPVEAFPGANAPFVLCVAGRDPFGQALQAIDGKPVQGRPLQVRRGVAVENLQGCHLAFFSDSEERRAVQALRWTGGALLTVSDIDGFIDVGGGIGLVYSDERIQFEVNLPVLQRAGLKASSQLLKLARHVVGARRN